MIVNRQDARLGFFVLAALALFLGLLIYKSAPKVAAADHSYGIHLDQLQGVEVGTPVLLQGYPVGRVEEVHLKREGTTYYFLAKASIRERIVLWEGTKAAVVGQGLSGTAISLVLPDDRAVELRDGATLPGEPGSSLDTVIAKADKLITDLDGSVSDLRAQFQKRGAGVLLDHPAVAKALKDLDATLRSYQGLADQGKHVVAGLDPALSDLQASLKQVRALLDNRSGDLDTTLKNLASLTQRMDALSTALDEAVRTDQPQLTDTLKGVKALTASMQELVELLKQKPHWVVWGTPSDAAKRKAKDAAAQPLK
ncbi:MAG TPA: MlaD family protein [Holophagaceae bacterium]|jgi:phospholipid/cholesterol/gamma-HCH transport system substrate-binding protein|nr:MlaD family protein [Holophagaceae bacterium]